METTPSRSSVFRSTLEALLVGAATPVGVWLGMALTEPSSPIRLRLEELVERGRRLADELREARIRRTVDDLIADVNRSTEETP